MKKIIFFTSSHKIGLTGQLAEQAHCFTRMSQGDFLFISGEKEQFSGLFKTLEKNKASCAVIAGLDEHSDFFRLVREFNQSADHFQADFVTVQTNWQLAIAVAAKYLFRKQYAIVYVVNGYRHNYKLRSFFAKHLIGLFLYVFAQHIITPSSFVKSQFSFLRNKNITIFIGENDVFFQDHLPPSFTGVKRFVFAGEFRAGKNQDSLMKTFKRYMDISGDDVELHLPGKGIYLDNCKKIADSLGLRGKVFFPGFLDREQMLELYLKCQFAIIPSNAETFGHCIVEPFILGRVVISKHVGIAGDIVFHNKTGFIFENEDDLLKILLSAVPNETLCNAIAKNALDQRDQFRWEVVCRQYFDLIYNI